MNPMTDLPRVRVHDDGSVAVYVPDPAPAHVALPWLCADPADSDSPPWLDDETVKAPGWRDAVIVTLPSPMVDDDEHHAFPGGACALPGHRAVHLAGLGQMSAADARETAASLLAAADYLDRHEATAVSDG